MLVQSFEKSVPSGTKRCTRCKKYKREFKPDSRRKDGLSSWCKDCVRETCREYARKRRAADPEAERAYQNAWRLAEVLAAPHLFQVLCRQCNRWKDVGPNCPCKYWDSISSNWREAREK